ncbi:MAG: ParB N-terminal domain-containing protein [Gammaproteobacteria bacterium]|nr:ParB N-terminal domain-containing protein [Gammaproteobacteria bacterium]
MSGPAQVEITRIRAYTRNPRRGDNPEYDRIRDSIRAHGMDQPLVITRRPGETEYMVHSGGNTRLRILRELFEETGDEQFHRVHCLIKPWTRESDVLLAHLRENDLRGSLTFIDKALAVQEAGKLLAQEMGVEAVIQAQLEAELQKAGYRIHRTLISRMEYAVETLLPLIPQALAAGLGRHQVQRIRALERAAANLWQSLCPRAADTFDTVFAELCRRYDAPGWDTEILQGAIETEIAEEAEVSIHSVRVALDAVLHGREATLPEVGPDPEPVRVPDPDPGALPDGQGSDGAEAASGDTTENLLDASTDDTPGDATDATADDTTDATTSLADPLALDVPEGPEDLKSLRARAWTLAVRLAQRNGIGELVLPLSGRGLGFVLRDVPDPALAEQLDDDSLGQVSMLWWQLAACCEMTFAPLESIVPELPEDSVLRHALERQDAGLLFRSVWTLDPGHTGYRLWRTLHDRDWSDLVCLMNTYRRIRNLAAGTGAAIWEEEP